MSALQQGGTRVYEPVLRFSLEIPADVFGAILPVLVKLSAIPQTPVIRGSLCVLAGEIPVAQIRELDQQLPALTRGEGVLETTFGRYQAVRGTVPVRPRSDRNPLDRKEYLLRVARRSGGR
jgi:ribosomal protection tetracycline resistance protein